VFATAQAADTQAQRKSSSRRCASTKANPEECLLAIANPPVRPFVERKAQAA
jgi:hypothetical protein